MVTASGSILIADDEPSCLKMVSAALQQAGYQCDTAADAPEAARMLREKQYDLLISDLEMPGNEDLRLIRDVPQIAAGLPVILMTGYPTVNSAIQAIKLPVAAYLLKPLSVENLLAEVRPAVLRYQAFRAIRLNHERVAQWNHELEQIESGLKAARPSDPAPWQALFELTLRNITDAVTDLRVFAEIHSHQQGAEGNADLMGPSHPLLLLNALREAVAVLEKTRSSFKSKDLGELRKKLESLIEPRRSPKEKR